MGDMIEAYSAFTGIPSDGLSIDDSFLCITDGVLS
jgi:hypothetical protein